MACGESVLDIPPFGAKTFYPHGRKNNGMGDENWW
jgi:hypothetical protein